MSERSTPARAPKSTTQQRRRAVASAFLGQVIEWYDFYLYATAAALIIGKLFFPAFDPTAALLASFATFTLGWFARPIGGLLLGHFGDIIGRRRVLLITIVAMGVSTALIGVLPTYGQIGVAAPIILLVLRIIQGLSAGGEYGGAVLMTVEHAQAKNRGFIASISQVGLSCGILLSQGVFLAVSLTSPAFFESWGWRIPFLVSFILVGVTVFVRLGLTETPDYARAQEVLETETQQGNKRRIPIVQVLQTHWRAFVAVIFVMFGVAAVSAINSSFLLSYATKASFDPSTAVLMVTVGTAVELVCYAIFAAASDRIGRRPVIIVGCLLLTCGAFGVFPLINTKELGFAFLGFIMMAFFHSIAYAPMSAAISEQFPTEYRYSGLSVGYQISVTLGAGTAPLIATALIAIPGAPPNALYVSAYVAAACLISMLGAFLLREKSGVQMEEQILHSGIESDHMQEARLGLESQS